MLWEVFVAGVVIACIVIAIYLLTRSNEPVTITRRTDGGQVFIKIRANKDITNVVVSNTSEQGELILKRSGLKKGEDVEFQVPISRNPVKVRIEDEKGTKSYDQPA